MKLKLYSTIMIASLLAACASSPRLAPLVKAPVEPKTKSELLVVQVGFSSGDNLEDNYVQSPNHPVPTNSSVVINVPEQLFASQSESSAYAQEFKTKDFFNDAEQQIERELIRSGFKVLSRSKFEAKLRQLRDENRCNYNEYSCLRSQVSEEAKPVLDSLKNKFDAGDISAAEYALQVNEIKSKFMKGSAGRSRNGGNNELTDISEVIRAAESGAIQADYVLQINIFDTNEKIQLTSDLRYDSVVRDFIRRNPQLEKDFLKSNFVSCPAINNRLNAKLLSVKTGEIVWIGEHSLNEYSAGVEFVEYELGFEEIIANRASVQKNYNFMNSNYGRQLRAYNPSEYKQEDYRVVSQYKKPTLVSGKCGTSLGVKEKAALARQVAKELIQTIKMK